MGRVVPFDSG